MYHPKILITIVASVLLLSLLALPPFQAAVTLAHPEAQSSDRMPSRQRVTDVDLLGEVNFETGYSFDQTIVGGLSGLTYDPAEDVYYALSDDRSQNGPARFFTVQIDLADGRLDEGDVTFLGVTTLTDASGMPYPELSLDPEGIALTSRGTLFIASEGDAAAEPPIDPFVNEYSLTGALLRELPVPDKYLPDPANGRGIRNNLAFESLTLSPAEGFLYVATENALAQDGPAADLEQESLSRVVKYDLAAGQPIEEYVYVTDPVAEPPIPADNFRTNGLVELLAIDDHGTALALERSFSAPVGNTVRLFEARMQGALDVSGADDLMWEEEEAPFEIDPPIAKRLLVDLAELGVIPDNLEGMAFGPLLPDGRQSLILVSDNNFNEFQTTQFIALALTLEPIGVAQPALETPGAVDEEDAPADTIAGDSDDPAIWLHPTDPAQSLVIATLKDGGLVVFDLEGQFLETIAPEEYGGFRYNNVDLLYDFELDGQPVDLVVLSDRENDTLAVYQIDPDNRRLADVTAPDILETIFGVDDGSQTAYGLATYTSPLTGVPYTFVSQADGNQIAQLELLDNGSGQVQATLVQTMTLPVPTGDPEDSQAEGMVVDRELGFLYVAMEDGLGILKFRAEPGAGEDGPEPVRVFNNEFLLPDVEGLTIYYGPEGSGYLLVSSQGDSTFAVFERSGDNAYLGSFTIGDNGSIDQVNESDGADLLNVALGPGFPSGLLVVQDGANDPQFVTQDDEELENRSTNFKFVPWENVANAFPEPLLIDPTSFNPRD